MAAMAAIIVVISTFATVVTLATVASATLATESAIANLESSPTRLVIYFEQVLDQRLDSVVSLVIRL